MVTSDAGTAVPSRPCTLTRRLLRCGTAAGVLFPVASFGQALARTLLLNGVRLKTLGLRLWNCGRSR